MVEHNRAKVMKKAIDDESGSVTLSFTDGGSILVILDDLTPTIQRRLALHGIAQKVGDAGAGKKADEAYEACMTVFERLVAGEWAATSERGEGARPTMVIEAIFRALQEGGKNPVLTDLQAKYTGEGAEERRKTALTNPIVKKHYEQLRAAAAAARAEKAAAAAEGGADLDNL